MYTQHEQGRPEQSRSVMDAGFKKKKRKKKERDNIH